MLKVSLFFLLVVAVLAYEEAPLNEKGEVIDTKEVQIAKELHYQAWDKAAEQQHYGEHDSHYIPEHEGHPEHEHHAYKDGEHFNHHVDHYNKW